MIDLTFLLFASLFSGFWVSLFTIAFFIAAIVSVSTDNYGAGVVSFILYSALLALFTPLNPFVYVYHNPGDTLLFIVLYLSVGAGYSIIKYRSWLKNKLTLLRDAKLKFIELYELNINVTDAFPSCLPNGASLQSYWVDFLQSSNSGLSYTDSRLITRHELTPAAQIDSISAWIAFWPFSALGLFIADPLKWLVTNTFNLLSSVYRQLYHRLISKYVNINDI